MKESYGLKWILSTILLFGSTHCGNMNECMTLVSSAGACSFPSNDSKQESTGLVECMDSCLSSSVVCRGIQWDSQHALCNRFSTSKPALSRRGCVAFEIGCSSPSDIICMKTVHTHKFGPGILIPSVKEEMNCRILCTMWESCLGVTWHAQKEACEVHEVLQSRRTTMRDYRDVIAVKDLNCSARCMTMTLNVQGKGYTTTSLPSFTSCVKTIDKSPHKSVVWKAEKKSCFVRLQPDDAELSFESKSARIHRSNTCSNTDVCYKKTGGVMMDRGFILGGDMTEEDCLSICQSVSNCAMVSYHRYSKFCTMLRVVTERRDIPPFNLYQITPCSDSETYRSIYFFKREVHVKNSQEVKSAKQTGSDVISGTDEAVLDDSSVLECAVQCTRESSCKALKLNTTGLITRCALDPKSGTAFRKLF